MSSPIHHAEDVDAALVYAPPWARDQSPPLSIPPAPQLPIERRRYGDPSRRSFSGDRAMLELQRKLSLDPESIPEPPVTGLRTLWPMVLRLSAVGGVAALVAWGMVSLTGLRSSGKQTVQAGFPAMTVASADTAAQDQPAVADQTRAVLVNVHAEATEPLPSAKIQDRIEANVPDKVNPVLSPPPAAPPLNAPAASAPPAAATPAAPAAPSAPAAAADDHGTTLQLSGDEIAMLVQRGRAYLTNGDFSSARLLLRRAAEAGNADAALTLGATFDPVVIQRLGAIGAEADLAKAREWYEKAAELGSVAARQQLAKLTPQGQ